MSDLYVSTAGLDTNPGTQSSPFATILAASQVAQPGDTVHVAAGTYAGSFTTLASGTAANPIHYVSDTKWGAVIVPPANSTGDAAWLDKGAYVIIDGFQVDGSHYQSGTPWLAGIDQAGSYSVIENCNVHNVAQNVPNTGGGGGITGDDYWGGVHIDIISNIVHNIGPTNGDQFHGIYEATTGNVENNISYGNGGYGIQLWHDVNHNNVVNNTVFNNDTGGILIGGGNYHITSGPADYIYVANNIVYGNTGTWASEAGAGIAESGQIGTHNTYTNNLVSGNTNNWYNMTSGHVNDVAGSPDFVNYIATGGGDYHLAAGSPAIDAGTATNAPATDFDGVSRPQGAGYDVGAYEFVTSPTPTPTPTPTSTSISAVAPALSVEAASGNEDTSIPLAISAAQAESDLAPGNLTVSVSGLQGATLNHGTLNSDGSYTLQNTDLQGLTLTPTPEFTGNLSLNVMATDSEPSSNTAATSAQTLAAAVHPVAEVPSLSVSPASGTAGTWISLTIAATQSESDLAFADLLVNISGLQGATLNHGTVNADGSYELTASELQGLKLLAPSGYSGTLPLTVTATDSEPSSGTLATTPPETLDLSLVLPHSHHGHWH